MPIQIQYRRGTAAQWTAANTLLSSGEPGYETDTGKFKVGDGSTSWNSLTYSSGTQGTQGTQGLQGLQGTQGTQGLQGTQGTQGVQGVPGGVSLAFNSGTTSTSSTANQFNFNNATVASVTNVYINNATAAALGIGDTIYFSLGTVYAQFAVSSAPSLSGSIYTVPVTYQIAAGTFVNGTSYGFTQANVGTQGVQGTQGTQGLQGTQGIQGTFGPYNTPIQAVATYTLLAADAGKTVAPTTGGVTINTSTFSAGDNCVIFNNSASNQTITQGAGVTLRLGGTATTGNRTLAQYGAATLLCVAANTYVIAGTGLS